MAKRIYRKTDFLFRIGGEEFALLLPKTALENASSVVENIRSSVKDLEIYLRNNQISISMSAGLTVIGMDDNAQTIYERADRALYDAKEAGRDQLVVSM